MALGKVKMPLPAERTTVALPTQDGTLIYTGSEQSPTWTNYDSSQITITGDTSATILECGNLQRYLHAEKRLLLGCVGELKKTNKSGKKNEILEANIKFV